MIKSKQEMKKVILHFALKYKGNWEKIYDAIKAKEDVTLEQIQALANEYDGNFMSIIDDDYMNNFKSIYMPPLTLFFVGNKSLISNEADIISLWGDYNAKNFNEDNLKKDKVYAINYNNTTKENVEAILKKGYRLILITNQYKANELNFINDHENCLLMTEIPFGIKKPDIDVEQTNERILIGVSKISFMLGEKQLNTFEYIEPLFKFEKRPIAVLDISQFTQSEIERFNIKPLSNIAN